ncbi:hypothetical protein HYZ82_02275 [Candidatus Nomurabacteria bacterium]|nr:hypothetical protein [Candidatus Nomurabacteria bacterium]
MKKYTLHILILIALFGIFIPTVKVDAECLEYEGYNQLDCIAIGGTWISDTGMTATCDGSGLGNIICQINNILGLTVPSLLALGMVYFIWGVVQYMIGGDGEDKKKGRDRIIYGLIGLSVILGVWGLVNIVVNTFDLSGGIKEVNLVPVGDEDYSTLPSDPNLKELLGYITNIINDAIVPLIFALAMVVFLWGVVQFVINSDDEAKKTKGKQFMIWGIIALTVMVSVWGLVNILGTTFGIDSSILPQVSPR